MKKVFALLFSSLVWKFCDCCFLPKNAVKSLQREVAATSILAGGLLLTSLPGVSVAKSLQKNECDDPAYKKSLFNRPPGVLIYPDYFDGTWATTFQFSDAKFTDQLTMKELSSDVNVAGFRKYGVAYMPDIGSSFTCGLRYTKKSGSVLEDREFNLRGILQSATQGTADEIEYDYKKDANRCSVKYHDAKGSGKQEMFTNFRYHDTPPDGSFHTIENIRQSTVRTKFQQRASQTIVDYGLEWTYLRVSPGVMTGSLKIISYLMPQDNLYFTRPEKPVGVFLYDLKLVKQ